jgi:isoleucyl-tRNA synthetase
MATRKTILKLLEDAKAMGIENSLDAGVCLPEHLDLAPFLPDLPDILGVSRVTIEAIDTPRIVDLRSHPRCERSWKRDTTVKEWPNGAVLSERDYHAITKNH